MPSKSTRAAINTRSSAPFTFHSLTNNHSDTPLHFVDRIGARYYFAACLTSTVFSLGCTQRTERAHSECFGRAALSRARAAVPFAKLSPRGLGNPRPAESASGCGPRTHHRSRAPALALPLSLSSSVSRLLLLLFAVCRSASESLACPRDSAVRLAFSCRETRKRQSFPTLHSQRVSDTRC